MGGISKGPQLGTCKKLIAFLVCLARTENFDVVAGLNGTGQKYPHRFQYEQLRLG